MTYVLSKSFELGRYKIAVVSRQTIGADLLGRKGVALAGRKEPAFVVVQDGHSGSALDMTGAKVPIAKVVELCPSVKALQARVR